MVVSSVGYNKKNILKNIKLNFTDEKSNLTYLLLMNFFMDRCVKDIHRLNLFYGIIYF